MEKLLTNKLQFEICKTKQKQNLASKEKVSHRQRFHSRQVIHESTKSLLQCKSERPVAKISR